MLGIEVRGEPLGFALTPVGNGVGLRALPIMLHLKPVDSRSANNKAPRTYALNSY